MEAPTASTSTLAASASTVVKPSHLQPPKKRPEATTSSQRLEDLQDAEPGASRPNYNWWQLIRAAINSAQDERLTLQGVYDALMARYSCFADDDEIWKNAIRHNLSVKPCFVRDKLETEKGSFWRVDHNVDPGKGRPRQRKRVASKKGLPPGAPSPRPATIPGVFEHAKAFADTLIIRSADQHESPKLKREFALGFDRHIAVRTLSALSTMADHPMYAAAVVKQRERMRSTASPLETVPHLAPRPDLNSASTPAIREAALAISDLIMGKKGLIPLPPGIGQRALPLVDKDRPSKSMPEILRECLVQSRDKRLTELELLHTIRARYPYYARTRTPWQSEVHSLLLSSACFQLMGETWIFDDKAAAPPSKRLNLHAPVTTLPVLTPTPRVTVVRAADVPAAIAQHQARLRQLVAAR